jgi:hypothetical protein
MRHAIDDLYAHPHTQMHKHMRRLISDQIQENQNVMQHVSLLHVQKPKGLEDDAKAKLMVKSAALQKVASKSTAVKASEEVDTHAHNQHICAHTCSYAYIHTHIISIYMHTHAPEGRLEDDATAKVMSKVLLYRKLHMYTHIIHLVNIYIS